MGRRPRLRRGSGGSGRAVVLLRATRAPAGPTDLPIVAVARFDNHTGDPAIDPFGDLLVDTLVEQLTSRGAGRFLVVGNAAILRRPREERDLRAIAAALQARYVVLTELHRDGERLRVLAHLIRLPEQTHLQVSRTDGLEDRSRRFVRCDCEPHRRRIHGAAGRRAALIPAGNTLRS